MTPKTKEPAQISRREATRSILYQFGGAALLAACEGGAVEDGSSSGPSGSGTGDGDSGTGMGTGTGSTTGSAGVWASGGTAAMTGAASYPDPFTTPRRPACSRCPRPRGPARRRPTDNIVGGSRLDSFILTTARMSDGAMLASKRLVVDVS